MEVEEGKDQNETDQNETDQNETDQNKTDQNKTDQNKTDQKEGDQNEAEKKEAEKKEGEKKEGEKKEGEKKEGEKKEGENIFSSNFIKFKKETKKRFKDLEGGLVEAYLILVLQEDVLERRKKLNDKDVEKVINEVFLSQDINLNNNSAEKKYYIAAVLSIIKCLVDVYSFSEIREKEIYAESIFWIRNDIKEDFKLESEALKKSLSQIKNDINIPVKNNISNWLLRKKIFNNNIVSGILIGCFVFFVVFQITTMINWFVNTIPNETKEIKNEVLNVLKDKKIKFWKEVNSKNGVVDYKTVIKILNVPLIDDFSIIDSNVNNQLFYSKKSQELVFIIEKQ